MRLNCCFMRLMRFKPPKADIDWLQNLAETRGETSRAAQRYADRLGARVIPSKLISPEAISSLEIVESGMDWPYAYVRLANGRTYYGHPSNGRRFRQYWAVRDKLPRTVSADAFAIAADVALRRRLPLRGTLRDLAAGTIIEAGAYIGIRAIAWSDLVGPEGRVVAVEIDPYNCDVMRLNVEANKLQDRIAVEQSALWSQTGEFEMQASTNQKQSMVELAPVRHTKTKPVSCLTLDDLIDKHGLGTVSFVNAQLNGAELHLLKGCKKHAADIAAISLVVQYLSAGDIEAMKTWLTSNGLTVTRAGSQRLFAERQ